MEKVDIFYRDLKKHGISGKQKARDLWRQKDITTIRADKMTLSVKVPAHEVALYKFTPVN
jgi:alpha-galactosidase